MKMAKKTRLDKNVAWQIAMQGLEGKGPKWVLYDKRQFSEYIKLEVGLIEFADGEINDGSINVLIKYGWKSFLEGGEAFMDACDEFAVKDKLGAMLFIHTRKKRSGDYNEMCYLVKKYKKLGGL